MNPTAYDRATLELILGFGRAAQKNVVSHGKAAYDADQGLQLIAQALCIHIGEAAKDLSRDLVAAHPEIQFKDMMAQRNRVAHGYRKLNLQKIWKAIAKSIPAEMARIQALLADHELAEAQRMREHANQESRQADAAADIAQHSTDPEEQERAAAETQQREAHAAWARRRASLVRQRRKTLSSQPTQPRS